ncbi:glycosyltransferase family 4 protein [Yinghuangia sp. YIM S09857]|uniref:glycosyltransferase family 4 protein n=1 Tax=Yinghuangia sp. YIM S09857 TaxID=3436929 RepID=UPI003F536EE0
MKISFLIQNIYGIGGTNRTVLNLAQGLAADHEVEIVSVFRRQQKMAFEQPTGVTVRPLVDLRPGASGADRGAPQLSEPSTLVPPEEEYYGQYSALTDERIRAYLADTDADVVVGTRSSLNLMIARLGRDDVVKIGQEHMTHLRVPDRVREAYRAHYPRLDAVTTVTEADARSFAEHTHVPGVPVVAIPNSTAASTIPPADGRLPVVIAAGRLQPVKRYDLLIQAFASLRHDFPEWQLRIYGQGPERALLRELISELSLTDSVLLMGGVTPLDPEWVKGSVAAVTSSEESFGMTLVEAMRCGLPVVSTDCPVGPREIITDGVDGLLAAEGDIEDIAKALGRLMGDADLRAAMGAAALENSRRYDPSAVAARYSALMTERAEARGLDPGRRPAHRAGLREAVQDRLLRRAPEATVDLTVGADGGMGFVLRVPPDKADATVALREVEDTGAERVVSLSTQSTAGHGEDQAVLTAALTAAQAEALDEGRWAVIVEHGLGRRARVRAGVVDSRGLLHRKLALLRSPESSGSFAWQAPYATAQGHLALRSWRRPVHAECTSVDVDVDGFVVHGVLFGPDEPTADAVLVLKRRGDGASVVVAGPSEVDGRRFSFSLPFQRVVSARLTRWEDWDWWLAPRGNVDQSVRVGRFLDDFVQKKAVYEYDAVTVADEDEDGLVVVHPVPRADVRAYCTGHSELSMNVIDRT